MKSLWYNSVMNRARRGFTIVEVALFLAVSGLLFIGIAAGVQNSVWQQRVNDSVQSFAEFLKTVYSQVSNPQGANTTGGRSDQAIYGKLISFGQTYDLSGNEIKDEQEVFVYDVIGDAESSGTGGTLELLKGLNAKVVSIEKDASGNEVAKFAGMPESYTPRWTAAIQAVGNTIPKLYEGSILIVRNPRSGTVSTFVSTEVLGINYAVMVDKSAANSKVMLNNILNLPSTNSKSFKQQEVNFCINPNGNTVDLNRRNVRLLESAHNASGVVIVGDAENACN